MKIIVAGASGEVGNEVLKLLANTDNSVIALVRRLNSIRTNANNISEALFDFDQPDYTKFISDLNPEIVICALGTTIKVAGTVEKFNRVDRDYPTRLIHALKRINSNARFALISSVGADQPRGVYLTAKYAVEKELKNSGLKYLILRPSFLMSDRKEHRKGEVFIQKFIAKPYISFTENFCSNSKVLWKYAPIPVAMVAKALMKNIASDEPKVLEGLELR